MGWIYLILFLMISGAIGGGLYAVHENGVKSGREACKAEYEAADKKLADKGAQAAVEYEDHINDMVVAYEQGLKEADKKVITVKSQGAKDVATYPVFSNPVCVLPADSLRLLNSARAGTGAPTNTSQPASPLRETAAPPIGNASGDVPADVGRRSPRGKVR